MSATLGGLIKDYRIQRGIQQLEIAYKIGWKDATILSRIEQGVTKTPSRQVIDKICAAMELEEEEKNNLLYVGGYIPTDIEVEEMRKKMTPIINEFKYPVLMEDFTWRCLYTNEAGRYFEYKNEEEENFILTHKPNAIEYNLQEDYFKSKFPSIITEEDKKEFFIGITAQFLNEQRHRTNQKWYMDLMKRLMENPYFRMIYKEAVKIPSSTLVLDITKQTVTHRKKPDIVLSFFMFSVPILSDKRFFLEYHVPADTETFNYYEKDNH
jgi:transcriptional regulator with XRE-family HTH domain